MSRDLARNLWAPGRPNAGEPAGELDAAAPVVTLRQHGAYLPEGDAA